MCLLVVTMHVDMTDCFPVVAIFAAFGCVVTLRCLFTQKYGSADVTAESLSHRPICCTHFSWQDKSYV